MPRRAVRVPSFVAALALLLAVVAPHGKMDGVLQVVPRDTVDNTAPAGGINANVADLTKWMLVQLDSGRIAGDRRLYQAARAAARAHDSKPSLALGQYAGRYVDDMYGEATLAAEACDRCDGGQRLVLRFSRSPAFVGDLEHWQYDSYLVHWRTRNLADAFATFTLDAEGAVQSFTMAPYSPAADFSFDYQDLLFRPAPATLAGER